MTGRRFLALLLATALLLCPLPSAAADPAPIDWSRVAEDSAALLSAYIRSTPEPARHDHGGGGVPGHRARSRRHPFRDDGRRAGESRC
jgi:hypothetical protein